MNTTFAVGLMVSDMFMFRFVATTEWADGRVLGKWRSDLGSSET